MRYWRLRFWRRVDRALCWPVTMTGRLLAPLSLAAGRRYLRECRRLEARGLWPPPDDEEC